MADGLTDFRAERGGEKTMMGNYPQLLPPPSPSPPTPPPPQPRQAEAAAVVVVVLNSVISRRKKGRERLFRGREEQRRQSLLQFGRDHPILLPRLE